MSKDIRSFFTVVSKKTTNSSIKTSDAKKKAKPILDSDEEVTVIPDSPPGKKSRTVNKRRVQVISSDSEDDSQKNISSKKLKPEKDSKLQPVNIDDVFDNTPIKQSKVEYVPEVVPNQSIHKKTVKKKKEKKKINTEIGIHSDENFEKTLLDLDDDLILENVDILDKTIDEALQKHNKEGQSSLKEHSNKEDKKRQRERSTEGVGKKPKLEQTDSGIDQDQEAFEKRRYSAMLYQKYKNRGGPKHHGEKELPQGTPDCLKNLTFLRTGVLDSLEGSEFENLVKEHGGRVVHAVSKKVNYVVVGEDPGPAKLDKARGLKIPEISEDDLLDMILLKSGIKPKFCKTKSNVSDESGIVTEEEILVSSESKNIASPSKQQQKLEKEKIEQRIKNEKHKKHVSKMVESLVSNNETITRPNLKQLSHSNKVPTETKSKKEEKIKEPITSTSKSGSRNITKLKDLPQIERSAIKTLDTAMCWTEKYKPKDIKSIIGQQGEASNMNKLKKWVQNWYRNQHPENHKRLPKPSPWAKNDDGAYFKAALLSGSPGVGKTTTATLVAKELGFDVVEFNASDTRNKKLLHQEVSQLLSTNTIAGFALGKASTDKKRVLLMDEVDGMAGNEDRGGIQELITLIKNSNIPIICMCNDRNHQKMRSLVNYCFDLRFAKPRLDQIRGAMMSICFKEGLTIAPNVLAEIINGTGCDIRQTLNHLSMWTAADKSLSLETAQKESEAAKKDTTLGPWEVIRKVFTESEQKNMSLPDRSRLFFYDYSLGPLFVQENYLSVMPHCSRQEVMKRVALTADAISVGDIIDSKIRSSNNWSLLEIEAIHSSVLPGFYMCGAISKRINFPGWLGKNSSANKHRRLIGELYAHTRMSTSGSKMAMKLDYLVPLRNAIIFPLKKYGTEGVHQALEVMKSYNLLREDLNNLVELCQWKHTSNPFNDIDAKVKSAFTRIYNKEAPLLPFSTSTAVSKKKTIPTEPSVLEEDELIESDVEDQEDITADAMIKVKNKAVAKNKKDSSKASTSKTKDSSKTSKGRAKKAK